MDACDIIAEAAAGFMDSDLDEAAADAAKRGVLDTVGVALAATGLAADEARPIVDLVREAGGCPESTAFNYGFRVPAPSAAMLLGALAHMLDYDDIVDSAVVHPSAPVVAAALPTAERIGQVTGRELLSAVALGQDIMVRLNMALRRHAPHHGWLPSVTGVFGAALSASRLLGLDARETAHALGLALQQAGGSRQASVGVGSSFRAVRDGFNARNGVQCALLAQRGMRGGEDAFEGPYGLFPHFFGGDYDRDVLLDGIGTTLRGTLTGHKPWPACRFIHLFIPPLLELKDRHGFTASDVVRITAVSNDPMLESQCEPAAERARPKHAIDAKRSLPFVLGKVLLTGTLGLDDFTEQGLRDEAASRIADRVDWRIEDLPGTSAKLGAGRVEIELTDGTMLAAQTEHPPGRAEAPLTWAELTAKFRDCAAHAASAIDGCRANEMVDTIAQLEKLADTSELLRILRPHHALDWDLGSGQ
jgi:2-methylcitrate dehydratase PrpD